MKPSFNNVKKNIRVKRDPAPVEEKIGPEPASGDKRAKKWKREKRIVRQRWQMQTLKPANWKLAEMSTKKMWTGTPDGDGADLFQYNVKKGKTTKFLVLELLETGEFACHGVAKYSFTKDVQRSTLTLEEAEAEMERIRKGGKKEKLPKLKLAKEESKDVVAPPNSVLSTFGIGGDGDDGDDGDDEGENGTKKRKKEVDNSDMGKFAAINTNEEADGGLMDDDNSEENELGNYDSGELTLDERSNMTRDQKKLLYSLEMARDGKDMESVAKELDEKQLDELQMREGKTNEDEFDIYFGKEDDQSDSDSSVDDDSSSMDMDSGEDVKVPQDGEEEDSDNEAEGENESSGEEDVEDTMPTYADIKKIIRGTLVGRIKPKDLAEQIKKLGRKIHEGQGKQRFFELVRMHIENIKNREGVLYCHLKEDLEKNERRKKKRKAKEILREEQRRKKAAIRKEKKLQKKKKKGGRELSRSDSLS